MERAPDSPVRLKCVDQVAFGHQALNKFYVAMSAINVIVSTSTRSFLRANFLLLAIQLPTLIPFRSVFFFT